MALAVLPDGGVAALPQMVIDLGDAPGAGLPGLSQNWTEVDRLERMLPGLVVHLKQIQGSNIFLCLTRKSI